MARVTVVEQRYRLQPSDLGGAPQRVQITEVSFQGLEELAPVLHFAGGAIKHLVLDARLRRELFELTGSSLCSDWVGQTIELQPTWADGEPMLRIRAPSTPKPLMEQTARLRSRIRLNGRALWPLLLLALALAALIWLEQSDAAFQWILDRLP